ncbi:hypothetical protein HDU98_000008 [Podochytrium sp. JEL0797]|nr:hypothetical protein HDU98_000008 [Podochytrium sp. JEL0797]
MSSKLQITTTYESDSDSDTHSPRYNYAQNNKHNVPSLRRSERSLVMTERTMSTPCRKLSDAEVEEHSKRVGLVRRHSSLRKAMSVIGFVDASDTEIAGVKQEAVGPVVSKVGVMQVGPVSGVAMVQEPEESDESVENVIGPVRMERRGSLLTRVLSVKVKKAPLDETQPKVMLRRASSIKLVSQVVQGVSGRPNGEVAPVKGDPDAIVVMEGGDGGDVAEWNHLLDEELDMHLHRSLSMKSARREEVWGDGSIDSGVSYGSSQLDAQTAPIAAVHKLSPQLSRVLSARGISGVQPVGEVGVKGGNGIASVAGRANSNKLAMDAEDAIQSTGLERKPSMLKRMLSKVRKGNSVAKQPGNVGINAREVKVEVPQARDSVERSFDARTAFQVKSIAPNAAKENGFSKFLKNMKRKMQ